ncbi:hypothetical protein WJX73_005982 [Symbiochloris irregularis]|uniref:2-phytyl-1,4-beta-naphthoquinone methyltransferase, chloroplastic n=1 Tax=Symbiochloris irregularis TaxID=706552 RepID=A0AAW1NYG1_9CHLO
MMRTPCQHQLPTYSKFRIAHWPRATDPRSTRRLSCRHTLSGRRSRTFLPSARAEGLSGEALTRQRLFNNVAPVYDELNNTLSLGQHRAWKKLAVQWCGAKEKDTLLDVCCGSGDLAHLLAAAAGPDGLVQAVDFSPDMLSYARRRPADWATRSSQSPRAPIEWTEGDALDLPFYDDEFDAATMGYGLRNVADIPASYGLREEYEYLQPSIQRFPQGRRQEQLALQAGFEKAVHYEVGFGLMGLLVLTKASQKQS